jgi:hypothetical protein
MLIPDNVPPSVRLPELVTVPLSVMPLTEPVPPTEVTVPTVLLVPAPMAVRKSAAESALIVLFALNRGNVTVEGLVRVNRFPPTVVAPRFVRAVAVVVAPVPPLATGRVPVTPVVRLTLVIVLLEPLMVLLVSVSTPSVVTDFPAG